MRKWSIPFFILALSACGPARVSIRYPAPSTPDEISRARALASAYLLISPPPRVPNTLLGKQIKKAASKVKFGGSRLFDLDAAALATALSKAVESRGGEIIAYRVADKTYAPFLNGLTPSGIIRISLATLTVDQTRYEKEITQKDSKTKKVTKRMAVYWKHKATLTGRIRFFSHPDNNTLGKATFAVTHSGELQAKGAAEAKRKWLKKAWRGLLKKTAKQAVAGIGNTTVVTRSRTLYIDKEDPDSKNAAKIARAGKWEVASSLWARRLEEDRGNWRDLMNLALASERVRLYSEAKRIYSDARKAAGPDPEATKVPWEQIQADLDAVSSLAIGRAKGARDWFAAPIAVLPFSDNTTSVDGPEILREMIWKALSKSGYNAIDLDSSDRALRAHGYSQGGQLHKGKHRDFAKWTGASRVLYGDITEFRDIMLGRFGKRIVAGTLRLWDAPSKKWIWKAEEPVINEAAELGSANAAKASLGNQIGRSFLEKWMGKPLGPESRDFVRINLETLPLRPLRK